MPKRATLAALFAAAALHPAALAAQAAAHAEWVPAPAPSAALAPAAAPLVLLAPSSALTPVASAPVGASSLEPLLAPFLPARHREPGVALMIVGGAGIVVGSIIDSGLVTVAGAGVGLYGLYLYLR